MYDSSRSQTLLWSQIWDMFWVACGRFMWFRCSQFPKMLKDVVSIMATGWRLWHSGCHSHLCPRQSISTQYTWKAQCRDTSKGWYNHHQHRCRVSYIGIPTSARKKTNYQSLNVWSVAETVSTAAWVAAEGSISTAGSTIVRIRVSWWQFLKGKSALAVRIDQIVLDLSISFYCIEHGYVQLPKSKVFQDLLEFQKCF